MRTAEQHEVLKQAIRAELAAVESRFGLAAVQVRLGLARGGWVAAKFTVWSWSWWDPAFEQAPLAFMQLGRCEACLISWPQTENLTKHFRTCAQVGGEFAVSTAEQRRQLQALKTLDTCLAALTAAAPGKGPCLCQGMPGSGQAHAAWPPSPRPRQASPSPIQGPCPVPGYARFWSGTHCLVTHADCRHARQG